MEEVDAKINDLKDRDLEGLTTPCSAFITFQCEEGVNRARKYDQAVEDNPRELSRYALWLDEFKLDIKNASEPSDIIWENRHFTRLARFKKELIVVGILICMLCVSFFLMLKASNYSTALYLKYPPVPCAPLLEDETRESLET